MAEDYTYIVARLRSLEAAMPERAWFERLVRTPGDSVLGALRENYHSFETVGDLATFETALEGEKAIVLELVTSLLREQRSKQFVRGGYDFDNLTHAWKAARLGAKPALVPFGLVSVETIDEAVRGKARGVLPPYLEGHIETLEAAFEDAKSLAACEYAGEAAKWRFLFAVASSEEERGYLRCKIDCINIRNLVRFRRIPLRTEALETIWIEGGGIEAARFEGFVREAEEEFYSFLATSVRSRLLAFGLSKETPLWRLDTILRQALMEHLGESRYRVFDVSPVLYHIELGERNAEILRRIIVGRLNLLPEETILERINALLPS